MNKTRIIAIVTLTASIALLSDPAYAQSSGALFDSGTNFLNALLDLLTNVWARIIGIIAIVVTGFIAMTGNLSWRRAFFVIFGLILIFGAAAIVDSVAGSI